jgi:hypothetical protein
MNLIPSHKVNTDWGYLRSSRHATHQLLKPIVKVPGFHEPHRGVDSYADRLSELA